MTPTDDLNPRQRGTLVEALGSAVFHGGTAIGDVPALLKRVLREEAWRAFETPMRQVVTHDRFESFVTTPPTRGLGTTPELIERIIHDDAEALLLYREAMKGKPGPHSSNDIVMATEQGNSKSYGLERLQRERPDLYEQVNAGQRSTHSAMVEAGFRRHMVSLPVDDVGQLAVSLRRHLTAEQLAALREVL